MFLLFCLTSSVITSIVPLGVPLYYNKRKKLKFKGWYPRKVVSMDKYLENRTKALEEFWRNTDTESNNYRVACVVDFLRHEISTCLECMVDPSFGSHVGENDVELLKAFVTVTNYLADCGDNEDMRTDRMGVISKEHLQEIYKSNFKEV